MAENRKDQQGQGNLKGQNQGSVQGQGRDQASQKEGRTDINKEEENDEQEGTKMPGKETRTPVAENDKRNQGGQANQGKTSDDENRNKNENSGRQGM